jgi:Holliday junction resolvasome RuvABC ATP-dependent DNA helicase subunit
LANITCAVCGRENREIAKYCRFCGKLIENAAASAPRPAASTAAVPVAEPALPGEVPTDYVGHNKIRAELDRIIKSIKFRRERRKAGAGGVAGSRVFVFRGDTGTGKTTVASCFVKELQREKCLESDRITIIGSRKLSKQYGDEFALAAFLAENKPSALVVDDVTENKFFIHELILAISELKEECFCVIAGNREGIDSFFEQYGEDKQRVAQFFDFEKLSNGELARIVMKQLGEKNYLFDSGLQKHFEAYITERVSDPACEYKNGWLVEKDIIPTIEKNQEIRLTASSENLSKDDYRTIIQEDLPLKNKPQTVDEVLAELDAMTGMTDVKKAVRGIANKIQIEMDIENKEREAAEAEGKNWEEIKAAKKKDKEGNNIIITGNPGTGKTTIVRTLGKLFKAMGLLPTDTVIETDGNGLKGSYLGQSKDRVNEFCKKAMGGILFVDEAYTLADENGPSDSFAEEAAVTLMKYLEDDRDKFVGIAAGYPKEMEFFLDKINPGMRRRFKHNLFLADYNADELFQIFKSMAKSKELEFTPESLTGAEEAINDMYNNKGPNFGNAGEIRIFLERIVTRKSDRLAELKGQGKELSVKEMKTIEAADIGYEKKKKLTVDEVLAELDAMIGMTDVKKTIREIANKLVIQQEIAEKEGSKAKGEGNNIVLTGNPGTGKTTIVRTMGKLFKAIGLLPTDNVIETDGNGLKGSYVGQSKDQVNEYCRKAMGGILFVDEAYTLAGQKGGATDDFAKEAAETLMKHLEDDRTKFVGVAAGYPKEMELFLDTINPGMRRRFKHYLHLPDYSAEELFLILQSMAKQQGFDFMPDAFEKTREAVESMYRNKGPNFGNAGEIRVFFEKITSRQSTRLAALSKEDRADKLKTITVDDIPVQDTEEGGGK